MRRLILSVAALAGFSSAEVLVVGYQSAWSPPFLIRDADQLTGMMPRISQAVAERACLELKVLEFHELVLTPLYWKAKSTSMCAPALTGPVMQSIMSFRLSFMLSTAKLLPLKPWHRA